MAGYKTHKVVGGFVGASTSFMYARNQPPMLAFAETLGGWFAGQYAGTWADIAEPAISSHHRDFCHALAPTACGATFVFRQVDAAHAFLRSQAQLYFQQAANTNDGIEQFVNIVASLLIHVAAGMVPAIPASYVSHIALDAVTPRSVPLLFRGI